MDNTEFFILHILVVLGVIIDYYSSPKRVINWIKLNELTKEECEFKDDQIGKYEMAVYEMQQETPKVVNKVLKNTEGLSYEK